MKDRKITGRPFRVFFDEISGEELAEALPDLVPYTRRPEAHCYRVVAGISLAARLHELGHVVIYYNRRGRRYDAVFRPRGGGQILIFRNKSLVQIIEALTRAANLHRTYTRGEDDRAREQFTLTLKKLLSEN